MSCGNPHDTDCREVLDKVYSYLDGELTEGDVAEIRVHLDECSPCLKEYDLDKAVKALVHKHCGCDPVPADLRSKVLARIAQVRSELAD
ncbi:anti-sigma factor [[Actinomadura] parvosata subsp. kistnae]|uniref:Mycothiol system anti-sigma-R factor n=2 Tax=Nonomuraea TaxID=83681 RepID=A0A1V0AFE9_9ACTN|nr:MULTISPECIES: mycothiol system anti-sigma-R factor [unclassified Nonomuraea]AQZ68940.1 mycothiol system anti-sigma-R factor [Nonomuraea sp. ATCC 55076]NJP90372.1 mycothiol system anti-sigma-R factor [Nonomuraea sp. FMUSA5-5]SPL92507.1 anti-sigma factor [Actinomadura parvosata subsp. kistnae]